jgi:lipopolysaccharide/colanic/teichoic acid biosynthesis glycosyltransferase
MSMADVDRPTRYSLPKFVIEWLLAISLFVLTAPLMLVLALLVKATSDGPAFYSQTRLGHRNRPYRIFKLRTMRHDCEAATGPVWASRQDSRVTPIGQWLRDTHLDELPQLWNVLRGEMSLIGPRPERPEIIARLEPMLPRIRDRLQVRPGITGLAQVRLPPDSDLAGVRLKLSHDLYYVRNLNPWLDARIAVATLFSFASSLSDAAQASLVRSHGRAAEQAGIIQP